MANRSKLELEIAQQTNKAIAELQQGLQACFRALEAIDANMKNSHMSLLKDITNSSLRLNFFAEFIREQFPNYALDEAFKKFSEKERSKMEKQVREAVDKSMIEGPNNVR